MLGRFLKDAWQRARTFYDVTDRRAVILSGLFVRNAKSLDPATLSNVSLDRHSDGSGTVTLGPEPAMAGRWGNAAWPGSERRAARFELVNDAQEINGTVRDARRRTFG